ncbi:MAG: M4 family metallopeptidase [Bacteroidota bacterium]
MKKFLFKHSGVLPVIFAVMFLQYSFYSMAQQSRLLNKQLPIKANNKSKTEWFDFKPGIKANAVDFFIKQKEKFHLSNYDDMRVIKTEKDKLGYIHTRFNQYYNGVKVEGAEYIVHEKDGLIEKANGIIIPNINLNANPNFTEAQALNVALQYVDAKKYLWEDAQAEDIHKKQKKDTAATWFPKGELVMASLSDDKSEISSEMHLCWVYDIRSKIPMDATRIYVDAKQGVVFKTLPLAMSCHPGSGTSTWHGDVTFRTSYANNLYFMQNDCSLPYYFVFNHHGAGALTNYFDDDNVWDSLNGSQQGAVESMWAIDRIWHYYLEKHGRNSWDNNSGLIIANINSVLTISGVTTGNNSCWGCEGNVMTLGMGDIIDYYADDWNCIDVIGHEFTHGVVQTTAGLVYQGEPGALNESFADIFGTMIERYSEPDAVLYPPDWTLNEDRTTINGPAIIRSFSDPKLYQQPTTYGDTLWATSSNDNYGVHTNSGIQNYWFYLLSVGGSGRNDNGDYFEVQGIGIEKAAQIAYRNLTAYLISVSDYAATRDGSIQAAKDLYGECSNEVIQTAQAWYAVGVGSNQPYYNRTYAGPYGGTYQAANVLTIQDGVVNAPQTPIFQAGKKVSVKPPFNANAGSYSIFRINPCCLTIQN